MKNNKHAYLIMTYKPDKIYQLLRQLDYENHDIYIHIDKKCKYDKSKIESCVSKSSIYILSKFDISWAHISQTMCQIFLLEQAIKNEYSYYHLLSESDFPLKTNEELHTFFENSHKNFVHFESKSVPANKEKFIKYYYLFQRYNRHSRFFDILEKININIQKIFHVNRIKDETYACGANWFSITNFLSKLIIANKEHIYKRYRYTRSSDEFYLQSLILKTNNINILSYDKMDDNYIACERYIDWQRGNPYVFSESDVDELIASNFCFARKINLDDQTREIIMAKLKER